MIYDGGRSDFPHKVVAIIQSLSLSENRKSLESQRNKVAIGTHETITLCHDLLASQLYQYHISLSLRLTIMCVANKMCGTAKIS